MQNPSKHHKLTSDNNIIKFKKPVHDPFNNFSGVANFNPLEGVIQLSDFMNNIYNLCSKDEPKSYWIGTT